MDSFDLLIFLVNLVAPAVGIACLLVWSSRVLGYRSALVWWMQLTLLTLIGAGTLGFGLWAWGRDGKMASYGALVVVMGTCQWLLIEGWRDRR